MKDIINNFREARQVLDEFISNKKNPEQIKKAGDLLISQLRLGGKCLSCGNGGSMSDAMHFAEELTGRFRDDRPAIPAIAISDPSHITCTANDYGFDHIFSRFIEGVGMKNDVLLAISTSGNSPNIIQAALAAQNKEMKIIALTGKDGGQLASICDVEIRAPKSMHSDRTQEIHIKIIHTLIDYIERNINA